MTPVKFFGFDIRELMRLAIATIQAQRVGESVPPFRALPAVAEDEATN